MPNRLIREGWLDSEAIDALSPEAERFFHRLCLTADDAGRFDGRIDILRARLFPLKSSLRANDVGKWQTEVAGHGLVIPYMRDGKPYLQVAKWQRCSPCVTSKYPWTDGTFRIGYVKKETRDGEKEFVYSSLSDGLGIPSEPIGTVIPRISGDGDGDGDGDEGRADARPAPGKGSRLPQDWTLPDDWKAEAERIAQEEGFSVNAVSEAKKFRDYWVAVSGQKGVKLDWLATWRNWVRQSATFGGKANGSAFARAPEKTKTLAEMGLA